MPRLLGVERRVPVADERGCFFTSKPEGRGHRRRSMGPSDQFMTPSWSGAGSRRG
ncbi:MAG: hypothetical protein U0527_17880 [Candidatus Eisenbacteria bacterium]